MWYIVQAKSNSEYKFKKDLEEYSKDHSIMDIIVPEYEGKKLYPGYILVNCTEMTDTLFNIIKSIDKFIRFLSMDGKPLPVPDKQIEKMLSLENKEQVKDFQIGQQVRIKEGPFQSMCGIIENINRNRNTISINIDVLGRITKLTLDFSFVEHV